MRPDMPKPVDTYDACTKFRAALELQLTPFFTQHGFVFEEYLAEGNLTFLFYRSAVCKLKFYEETRKDFDRNCLFGFLDSPNDANWEQNQKWFFVPSLVKNGPHTSESSISGDCSRFLVLKEIFELALKGLAAKPHV